MSTQIQTLMNDNGSTLLLVTPTMLKEFAEALIKEALENIHEEEEKTYTPKEFAQRHRVDQSTLWRWVNDGILTKTIIGGKVFYKDSDLKKKRVTLKKEA